MATLDRQVAASADDIKVGWDGSAWGFNLTGIAQIVGYYSSTDYKNGGGMRFLNITIPKGSTITAAYITLTCRAAASLTVVNSKIKGEAADNPVTFSTLADYQGRAKTTAVVSWDAIPAWTKDTDYNSPEIKTIIQEIIDRANWSSGNALVIFWDDHDNLSTQVALTRRPGYSYDDSPTKAPKLHIEYTPAAKGRSFGFIIG